MNVVLRQNNMHIFGMYAFDKATDGQTFILQENGENTSTYLIEGDSHGFSQPVQKPVLRQVITYEPPGFHILGLGRSYRT